jgi:hypothetical protein
LALKLGRKPNSQKLEVEAHETAQLPFASQQDFISTGLENEWEGDSIGSIEEPNNEEIEYMY